MAQSTQERDKYLQNRCGNDGVPVNGPDDVDREARKGTPARKRPWETVVTELLHAYEDYLDMLSAQGQLYCDKEGAAVERLRVELQNDHNIPI